MKRGAPLRRKTPLKPSTAGAHLKRAPIERHSSSTSDFAFAVKGKVRKRSGGWCEFPGCTRHAQHFHHRLMRSQGGAGSVDNCAHLCTGCHSYVHANPRRAYELGLLVPSWSEEAAQLRIAG